MLNCFDDEAERGTSIEDVFVHDLLYYRRLSGIVKSATSNSATFLTLTAKLSNTDSINIRISLSLSLAFLKIESILMGLLLRRGHEAVQVPERRRSVLKQRGFPSSEYEC